MCTEYHWLNLPQLSYSNMLSVNCCKEPRCQCSRFSLNNAKLSTILTYAFQSWEQCITDKTNAAQAAAVSESPLILPEKEKLVLPTQ